MGTLDHASWRSRERGRGKGVLCVGATAHCILGVIVLSNVRRTTWRTTSPKKPAKACAHPPEGVCSTRCWTLEEGSELPVLWSARCPRPRGRPGGRSSVTMLTESVLTGMLDGRQRRGSSAPTSDMPGTTPNRCGRTWPRWGWLWTPTRRCPSVRER